MGNRLTKRWWPIVTIIPGAFITWATTTNLDVLPPWAKTIVPLGVALATALVTMYGLPGVSSTPGVWSAESVEKLTENNGPPR